LPYNWRWRKIILGMPFWTARLSPCWLGCRMKILMRLYLFSKVKLGDLNFMRKWETFKIYLGVDNAQSGL
jgi:hypothetical protein